MLTPEQLRLRAQNIYSMLKDKRTFVRKYGKDAEKMMYGIATKQVLKKVEENKLIPKYRISGKKRI